MVEKIVIPENFYVNYSISSNSYFDYEKEEDVELADSKLGFATYQENNAAFRKRQATIDGWAGQDFKGKGETLANAAREGFKLGEMTTHGGGWNDTSTYWRVVDPTGFELEISAGNVAKLFQYCSIDKGAIAGECVWGWDKANGSKPVLIPCNSQLYVQAKKSSDIHHAASLNIKEIPIGSYVELKNGEKGIFYGKVTVGYYGKYYGDWSNDAFERGFCKMLHEDTYAFKVESGDIFLMNTPKVIKVEPREVISKEVAEKQLNSILLNRKDRYGTIRTAASNKNDLCYNAIYFSYNGPQPTEYVLTPLDVNELRKLCNIHNGSLSSEVIVELKSGQKLIPTEGERLYHNEKLAEDFTTTGHLIIDENLNTATGILVEKNPHWEPKTKETRYSYDRQQYSVDRTFKASAIKPDGCYQLNIKFKDYVQKVFR